MSNLALDCNLDPGAFNTIITFKSKDSGGEFTAVEGTTRARIEFMSGREDNEADTRQSKGRYKITAKYPKTFNVFDNTADNYHIFATINGTTTEIEMRVLKVASLDFTNKAIVLIAEDWARFQS